MVGWWRKPLSAAHLRAGASAERAAERYLRRQGLRLRHRNYRCRGGELDLVMADSDSLIFVEVRHRRGSQFGGALASVTAAKQQRLLRAAHEYLLREKIPGQQPCRCDVVTVEGDLGNPRIEWIRHAFDLDSTGAF